MAKNSSRKARIRLIDYDKSDPFSCEVDKFDVLGVYKNNEHLITALRRCVKKLPYSYAKITTPKTELLDTSGGSGLVDNIILVKFEIVETHINHKHIISGGIIFDTPEKAKKYYNGMKK